MFWVESLIEHPSGDLELAVELGLEFWGSFYWIGDGIDSK